MGFLTIGGAPLSWPETKSLSSTIRASGIRQFIRIFHHWKDTYRSVHQLKCGDEMEYIVVRFDDSSRKVFLSLRATELLKQLQKEENNNNDSSSSSMWYPEFGEFMLECVPKKPYQMPPLPSSPSSSSPLSSSMVIDGKMSKFLSTIESNICKRRQAVRHLLESNETLLCLSSFPHIGCGNFFYHHPSSCGDEMILSSSTTTTTTTTTTTATSLPNLGSRYFPEIAINQQHPRFVTLTKNFLSRRGPMRPMMITVPLFRDTYTNVKSQRQHQQHDEIKCSPEHIYMDSSGFGWGCCCLQVTMEVVTLVDARTLYDQLIPLAPIFLALTAGSPIFRGYLADIDTRWPVIVQASDDRTIEEIGTGNDSGSGSGSGVVPKSRYDSVDLYLSPINEQYNDIEFCVDQQSYDTLRANGVDHHLSQHIAHLFTRDPLVLFEDDSINVNNGGGYGDDENSTDHFENIQSTNWQTVRFKPPPLGQSTIGWRVEFRPMELQLTNDENIAFIIFIILLSRLLLLSTSNDDDNDSTKNPSIHLPMPISLVDENMCLAHKRDSILNEQFWFRTNIITEHHQLQNQQNQCEKMSINTIINGGDYHHHDQDQHQKSNKFIGLIPLLRSKLATMSLTTSTMDRLNYYLNIISQRASGTRPTPARFIRRYCVTHADYRHDSVVNDSMCYDLCRMLQQMLQQQDDNDNGNVV